MSRSGGRITAALLAGVLAAGPVWAQGAAQNSADPEGAARHEELPVSLERIRRELASAPRTAERRDGLRLQYYVEVYGKAPKLELFTPDMNLTTAPVRYGGMTHQEFMSVVTPEEFRAPAADISGAIAAFLKWAVERKKTSPPNR